MNHNIDVRLKRILSDKTSGSVELLRKLNRYLALEQAKVEYIKKILPELKKHFSSFENIRKYLSELNKLVRAGKLYSGFFSKYTGNVNVHEKIFSSAFPSLKRCSIIMTISNSRTILEFLKRIQKEKTDLKVIVCESRPEFEGRIMAAALVKGGVKVQLITESMAAEYVQKSDAVIIGADVILKNGNVVNKVGSKTLSILCREYGKPFYVVADKSKFSSKNNFKQNKEDRKEIWRSAPKKISIKNYNFEIVPKSYVTNIFTD